MIEFKCGCGKALKVPDKHAGKRGKCPFCGQGLLIPAPGGAVPSPQAQPSGGGYLCAACGGAFTAAEVYRHRGRIICRRCFEGGSDRKAGLLGTRKPLVIGAVAAAVLIVVAVPVLYFALRGGEPAEEAKPAMRGQSARSTPRGGGQPTARPPKPKPPKKKVKPPPPPRGDKRVLQHDLLSDGGQLWQVKGAGKLQMKMRITGPNNQTASVTINMDFTGDSQYGMDQATRKAGRVDAVWKPLRQDIDLDMALSMIIGSQSKSGRGKGQIVLSPKKCSGWMKVEGEPKHTMSSAELGKMRDTAGIGSSIATGMTPQGRLLDWKAASNLSGRFGQKEQQQAVALVSGIIVPIFPDAAVGPGDSWRVTPGSKGKPVVTYKEAPPSTSRPAIARRDSISIPSIARSLVPKAGGGGGGGMTSLTDGGILNPFGWGVPLDYVHHGPVTKAGRKCIKLHYSADIKNPKIDFEDPTLKIKIRSIVIDGDVYFDPARGRTVLSTAKWKADLNIVSPDSTSFLDVVISVSSEATPVGA